jgi:predicted negative regulator of RcsB-dependent stress response
MTTKLSKDDIKNPDALTQELKKGFVWSVQHSNILIAVIALFILSGVGYSAYSYFQNKKNHTLLEKYYQAERAYYTQKELFEAPPPMLGKDGKTVTPTTAKPTGDLDQDYGKSLSLWNELIQQAPGSQAAMMAALHVSDLYSQYNKKDLALATINKIVPCSDLLTALVLDKKASLQAENGDCKTALSTWEDVLKNKHAGFMTNDVKLKKGLCFENLNDASQAQAMYTQVRDADSNSPTAKTAEKYLRVLQTKKN